MKQSDQNISVKELEVSIDRLDIARATAIYEEHGAVVVRGLSKAHVKPVLRDINAILQEAVSLLPKAVRNATDGGLYTPNGARFADDPKHPGKPMLHSLKCNGLISAAFMQSLLNPTLLDILEAILGPDIELWKWGQCAYKQPGTENPISLHQDGYYFQHKHETPIGVLSYAIDTDLSNGPLHIVPGSHRLGPLEHVDDKWAGLALADPSWWEKAIPLPGRAGDAILFHGYTIHGSTANRSDRPRPVFIQRYRRADDFCIINVATMKDRREAEKKPIQAKTADDWGLMVRGLRRYYTKS